MSIFNDDTFRLVNAATGTGKTIAYLAPIIHYLQDYDPRIQRSDGTLGSFVRFLFARASFLITFFFFFFVFIYFRVCTVFWFDDNPVIKLIN